jgi:hypothetical protein
MLRYRLSTDRDADGPVVAGLVVGRARHAG